ncbi:MAG: DsrE family protein [Balneola sp.]|jgi:intracellular sulfur oxidation DsrE/DsrF family protein
MKYLITFFVVLIFSVVALAQKGANPIIKNFGTIYEIEGAVNPDPEIEYKIVVDLKTLQRDKESINPGLNNVARMLNLHGLGGVKSENLNVVVAIHGGATDVILNNEAYQRKYELDNPNLKLIDELKEAGVELYVCGQSLLARNYEHEEVNRQIKIGLSMLTVVTTYMHKGYHQMVFE